MYGSKQAALISAIVAVGAAARIVLGEIAMASPMPLFGMVIKVGLSETLSIAVGLALGATAGFVTGVLIIVVSDLFTLPGAWTPFIASIIGLLGFLAGISRRWVRITKPSAFVAIAALLTALSEFLQNAWVSAFYNLPISAVMLTGLPSLVTALANNIVLLSAGGPRLVRLIRGAAGSPSGKAVVQ